MEVIVTPEFNDLEECAKTFGNTVYLGYIGIEELSIIDTFI